MPTKVTNQIASTSQTSQVRFRLVSMSERELGSRFIFDAGSPKAFRASKNRSQPVQARLDGGARRQQSRYQWREPNTGGTRASCETKGGTPNRLVTPDQVQIYLHLPANNYSEIDVTRHIQPRLI